MKKLQEDISNKLEAVQAAQLIVFKLKNELNELYIKRGDKIREFSSDSKPIK
jgi:hypothetical protein